MVSLCCALDHRQGVDDVALTGGDGEFPAGAAAYGPGCLWGLMLPPVPALAVIACRSSSLKVAVIEPSACTFSEVYAYDAWSAAAAMVSFVVPLTTVVSIMALLAVTVNSRLAPRGSLRRKADRTARARACPWRTSSPKKRPRCQSSAFEGIVVSTVLSRAVQYHLGNTVARTGLKGESLIRAGLHQGFSSGVMPASPDTCVDDKLVVATAFRDGKVGIETAINVGEGVYRLCIVVTFPRYITGAADNDIAVVGSVTTE